jgi:hypothetical protein
MAFLLAFDRALASLMEREKFHGRIKGRSQRCAHPGCMEPGEFRAPSRFGQRSGFDGPGDWQWLCLEHVREFNLKFDWFQDMSQDEIEAAQTPYAGWATETRAFTRAGVDSPPKWSDFHDPLDAISSRFRQRMPKDRADGKTLSPEDRRALKTLGLGDDADRRALRGRYSELVRRYHPDRNGGDRSHEKALQDVIAAYTHLKSAPAFI